MVETIVEKQYNGIDVCKLVMAILVVAIHTNPMVACENGTILSVYNSLVSLAVPFFFIASGFFLGKKMTATIGDEENLKTIKSYLFRIIKLYLLWTIIYLPLTIYDYVVSGDSIAYCIALFVRGLFLIGEHYNSWILWYLLSTIYALTFIYFMCKMKVSRKILLLVSTIVLLIGFSLDSLVSYTGELAAFLSFIKKFVILSIDSGRIFRGVFFITIGVLFSKKEISLKLCYPICLIGFLLNIIFDGFLGNVCLAISSIALFGIAMTIKGKKNKCFPIMRQCSTVIYFIHLYVWSFYYAIVYGKKTYGVDSFIIVSIVSLLIALCWTCLKNINKNKQHI